MTTNEKPQIIVLEPVTKTVEDLLKAIEEQNQANVIRLKDADEAEQLARHHEPCVLFACINENAEIPARVNMLKKLRASIKRGLVKTLLVSKIKNRQINSLIASFGVTDFMEEPVPVRTLLFKANLQIKAVLNIRRQQSKKPASEEKTVFKKSADGKKTEESNRGGEALEAPALDLGEDVFLFRKSGVKKFGKKIVMELEGPSPDSGDWVPHEDKGDAQSSWRWVPKKEEEDSPATDPTEGWVHEGDKPMFQEATEKWQMASDKPELSFRKNGKKLAKKITTDENGNVVVAEDSPAAEKRLGRLKQKRAQKKEALAKAELEKEAAEKTAAETKLASKAKGAKEKPPGIGLAKELEPSEPEASGAPTSDQPAATKKEKKAALSLAKESENNEPVANSELAEEEHPGKKKALPPLDSPKQEKEKLNRSAPLPAQAQEQGSEIEAKEEISKNNEISTEPALEKEKVEKTSTSAAKKTLDRMQAKPGGEELSVEPPSEGEEAPAEFEETESGQSAPKRLKNKATKARTKSKLSLAVAEPTEQTENKGPPPVRAEKKRAQKKALLLEIQDILDQPLPEDLSAASEQEIRQELGEEDPAVTGKELVRKKRLKQIKELKAKLGELDLLPEIEELPEPTIHDLSVDEPENKWSDGKKGPTKERTKIRAFDSDTNESEEEDTSADPLRRLEALQKENAESKDNYTYLPRAEVKPIGGAWEKADSYFAFLPGEVRYHGFAKIEDLLPLWIFDGDQVPELLDRTEQWRFAGKLPMEAKTVEQIPLKVHDFLLALRDQIAREKAANKEHNEPGSQAPPEILEEEKSAAEQGAEENAPDLAAGVAKEPAQDSSAIESFQERRKRKKEAKAADPLPGELPPSPAAKSDSINNPYLGVYVALSNSLGPHKDPTRAIARVLKAIESAFKNCQAFYLGKEESQGSAPLIQSIRGEIPEGSMVNLNSGLKREIRLGESAEILGYLLLQPTAGREHFLPTEEKAMDKVAKSFSAVIIKDIQKENEAA
jgi:hypothetical protein